MEIIRRKMPQDYEMWLFGDLHLGSINCNREGVRGMIAEAKARKGEVFLANLGDNIEAILPSDKRWASCAIDWQNKLMTPGDQLEWLVREFGPVAEQILAWCDGNHEYKLINTLQVGKKIAAELGVPYGGVHYKFVALDGKGRVMNKAALMHGNGSLSSMAKDPIQAKANMRAKLKHKLIATGHTDCILMVQAHTHRPVVVNPTVTDEVMLTDNGKQLKQKGRHHASQKKEYIPVECRWYGCIPSFRKLYTPSGSGAIDYGEVGQYGPLKMGWLVAKYEGGELVSLKERFI